MGAVQDSVFVSGQDGYHTYRIPAVIVSSKGTILAFCEGRKASGGDAGNIDLLLRRSLDSGKTWQPTQVVWDDGDNTCGNPCPVVDASTGAIWLLLTHNLGEDKEAKIIDGTSRGTRTAWVSKSTDDGVTWSAPIEITRDVKKPDWTWYATGPGVGIQLRSGRLLIPCDNKVAVTHGRQSHVIYSDDHGATWKLGGVVGPLCNESQVVELSDGRVMLNMRSYQANNRRLVATSSDGGLTFSAPAEDKELIEPVCQASILRYPASKGEKVQKDAKGGKARILFSNPASTKREKMTVRYSDDDGATWKASRELFAGPSAYSCLTVLSDGTIGCLYERGEKRASETITFARFPLSWLTGEAAATAPAPAALPARDANAKKINTNPGPKYADSMRLFQGIPGIERAANGRLWALWYAGGENQPGEGPGNYVVVVTSGDDGKTWSPPRIVVDPHNPLRAYDPCLWHDPLGRLWMFWAESYGWWDGRAGVWAAVSENSGDENPNWSEPRRLANGIMMNKPTVLSTGEWLLPAAVWERKADRRTDPAHRHDLADESGANVHVSNDQGVTWLPLGKAIVPKRIYDEHSIIERHDGSLWMLVRAAYGVGESFSSDQGKTWSDGRRSSVPNVNSRFFVRRLTSGKLLLVSHLPPDERTRSHLVAKLSDDDGKTWSGGLMIDERPGVSYPDGVQSPAGTIYLIYDYQRTRDRQILMATFTEQDVAQGTWNSPQARQRVVINQATGMRTK